MHGEDNAFPLSPECAESQRGEHKSTTSNPIILDKGWERCYAVDHRYQELRTTEVQNQAILVIEICCAEPIFQCGNNTWLLDARPGATRNPAEWVAILKDQGRHVFSFLLWASWPFVRAREEQRKNLSLSFCRILYDFYNLTDWRDFASKAEIPETKLDVESLQQKDIANIIWNACDIPLDNAAEP